MKLQEERSTSVHLFKCGMDDQDPYNWDDVGTLCAERLVEDLSSHE